MKKEMILHWHAGSLYFVTVLVFASGHLLDFYCNTVGIITVTNPTDVNFTQAFARTQDGSINCTVTMINDNTQIQIEDCPISTNIYLWLLNTTDVPIILTSRIDYHTLMCEQLPASGVYRKVTNENRATNLPPSTSIEPTVTPSIVLNTQIEDIETGLKRQSAIVGEPLIWEIEGPVGYVVKPINCSVTSGTVTDYANIVINGCSLDTYLVSHFRYPSEFEKYRLVADFYAFRFASSSEVIIVCDLIGCTIDASGPCSFSCPTGRRKRDEFSKHLNHLALQSEESYERIRDAYKQQTRSDNQLNEQVSTSLLVYGLEELFLSNGSPSHGTILSLMQVFRTVVLALVINKIAESWINSYILP